MAAKPYYLNIRHKARKVTIKVPLDHTLGQVKDYIHCKFGVQQDKQILFCNGKRLDGSDHVTIKQIRIPSGSKITFNEEEPMEVDDEDENKIDILEKKTNDLEISILAVDNEIKQFENEDLYKCLVDIENNTTVDVKVEVKITEEELMQILLTLDHLLYSDSEHEFREKRKKMVLKIQNVIQRNEVLKDKLNFGQKIITEEFNKVKVKCKEYEQQLNVILVTLDQIHFTEHQQLYRAKRKDIVTKVEVFLDHNKKILEKIALRFDNITSSFAKFKYDCRKTNEDLANIIDTLDQITYAQEEIEQKMKHKQISTKLQNILDRNRHVN